MTNEDKVRLARVAISNGLTRGQFIREHTGHDETKATKKIEECLLICQVWSDAYSEAMQQIQDETSLAQ